MITYTKYRTLFGRLSGDNSTENLDDGMTIINETIREIITSKPYNFRETSDTDTTVADQQFYYLPHDCGKLINSTITVGTTKYTPKECTSRALWDRLNQSTNVKSNIAEWFFIFGKQIGYYPTLSSSGYTITHNYLLTHKDLGIADYTTGTISAVTNADATVTGSGTSWNASMAGRYIRITASDAANVGDGEWYQISSVTSATVLELVKPYEGTTITAGSATYTIGQISSLPEDHQMLPLYRALEIHFTSVQPETERAALYKRLFQEGISRLNGEQGSKTTNI